MIKNISSVLILIIWITGSVLAENPVKENENFSFAFFTDIHLNKGHFTKNHGGFQGIEKAIESAKANNIDFILTGGDNVDIDILKKGEAETAHNLYKKYAEIIESSEIEYHATIGNHDRFCLSDKNDELYNDGLFEKYINKSYYSFDHKGWHFIILNSTQICNGKYCVDDVQKQWLANDLKSVNPNTPIIVSTHVPFLSVYYPALDGKYTDTDTFSNFKEIWDMFEDKNLKLVLQGHMHLYEEIKVRGVQFITAGAVSASWWGGAYHGTEEGYLKINTSGDDFSWEYIDYGWEANK
ncbi:metallophosphoesterase [Draconibacterium orientale]|uniref:metallophosphoesterase family protein n=1 Tax=Draconibacterium orientale TaxID=1168034 RepID=UPI0029C0C50F|nr:metallophosphoesterase [Draconibacterium orientale]